MFRRIIEKKDETGGTAMAETGKNERVLDIYTRLLKGETINKFELASRYGVNEKSIQRDIE